MTDALVIASRKRTMAKLIGSLTALMVVPPVLAGVFGTLGLAVVVGVLSIFVGLLGMSLVVSKWEFFERRANAAALPKARLLP
jgi:hypothetical protein